MPATEAMPIRSSGLKGVVANTAWLLSDNFVRMAVGLPISVWVARYLGPSQFGLLSYAAAFVALFGALAGLGLDAIVVRELVREPEGQGEILGSAFLLKLSAGIGAGALAVGSAWFARPGEPRVLVLVALVAAGGVFQALDSIDFWFQSRVLSKYTVLARNTAFLTFSGVKAALILGGAPLVAFAAAGLGEVAVGALGLAAAYKAAGQQFDQWTFSRTRALRLLGDSWPVILGGISIMIYMKIDQVMLGRMVGDREVGIYSAAVRLSEMWYFIPAAIGTSVYPTLIKAYQHSEALFYRKLKKIMGYVFWGSLLLSLIVANQSDNIIGLVFGRQYLLAGRVLSVHIYSGIIVAMSIVFSQKYVIDGTTRVSLYGAVAGAIANVFLNIWLIPMYGALGAAIATVVSYVVPLVFLGTVYDRRIMATFIESIYYPLKG